MRIRAYSAPTVSRESRETMNAMSYAFEESTVSQEAMSIYRDLEKFGKVSDEFFSLSFEGNMSRARIIYNQKEVMRLAKIMNFKIDIPTISTEDCENNIEYARQLSIESGDSFLSRMWDSIVDFINRVIDWFKNLFGSSSGGGGGGGSSAQAKELLEDQELKEYVDKLKSDEKVKSSIKHPTCSALNQIIENDPANLNGTISYAFELVSMSIAAVHVLPAMISRAQELVNTLTMGSMAQSDAGVEYTAKVGKVQKIVETKVKENIDTNDLIGDSDLLMLHVFMPWISKDNMMCAIRYKPKSGAIVQKVFRLNSLRELVGATTVEEYYFTKAAIDDYPEVLNYVVKNSSEINTTITKTINALGNLVKQINAKEKAFSKIKNYESVKLVFEYIRGSLNLGTFFAKSMKDYNDNAPKLIAKIKSDLKEHFKGKEKDKEQGAEA